MIYLDHAATSWPKPPEVLKAMNEFLEQSGGNPGRSGHRLSIQAGRIVYETREVVAKFFNAPDPLRVIFTHNATHAINVALFGILKPGDTVVTTSIEHNAVMRPLRALEKHGIKLRIVPCDAQGFVDIEEFERTLASGVRLVVIAHGSNVIGTIQPIADLSRKAHQNGAIVFVDAAQTAGASPIDMQAMGIDLLAFTGHKALQGPPGIGGLILGNLIDAQTMVPLIHGGTGSNSDSDLQPVHLPDRFESGTINGPGIAGLRAAIEWIKQVSMEKIRSHHRLLLRRLIEGLKLVKGITVYGPPPQVERTPVVSFTAKQMSVSEIGLRLDNEYGIMCRVGLHCAPAAHRTLGTFPSGTVRFSIGPMTTEEEIDQALAAVESIQKR